MDSYFLIKVDVMGLINVIKKIPKTIDTTLGIIITEKFDIPETFNAIISSVFLIFKKNKFFKNILSNNLTLKKIISYFKRCKKIIKIKYENSKLINQYSYKVSNKKFTQKAFSLKSNIYNDIKSTLKMLQGVKNEMQINK